MSLFFLLVYIQLGNVDLVSPADSLHEKEELGIMVGFRMTNNLEMKMRNIIRNMLVQRKSLIVVLSLLTIVLTLATCKTTNNNIQTDINDKTTQIDQVSLSDTDWEQGKVTDYHTLTKSFLWNSQVDLFYQELDYQFAWFKDGRLTQNASELIATLESSWKEGFVAENYEIREIEMAIHELQDLASQEEEYRQVAAQLDILLSRSYLSYASDIANGRNNPQKIDANWETYPQKKHNLVKYLSVALKKDDIQKSLVELRPKTNQYEKLMTAYQKLYLSSQDRVWPLPAYSISRAVEENDSSGYVVRLKSYLFATGDLKTADSTYLSSPFFDNKLTEAVKHFQFRHGLEQDGIVGKNTQQEMNKSIDYRLDQIGVNLDRLRWLPDNLGDSYIEVNIPEFSLKYFESNQLITHMNVVVGRNKNYTPVLKDTLSYLVFNPTWNVPNSIATKEMLPKIKADSTYLARNNYVLLKSSYISKDTINPAEVEWSEITRDNFSYRIVQKSGRFNALGTIKFIMPNNHNIYLHDTPSHHLFSRAQRNFSHGCIRVEKPLELAQNLLEAQINNDSIYELLAGKEPKTVILDKKVAVHMFYHTAWVDKQGNLQFRKDIYSFDEKSITLLKRTESRQQLVAQGILE